MSKKTHNDDSNKNSSEKESPTKVHYFTYDHELVLALSKRILKNLRKNIEKKGRASLVVSGGSTPKALFHDLSQHKFPWDKVSIILADDRCVNVHSDNSNYNLLNEYLLKDHAADAKFIPLYSDEDTAQQAAVNASRRLSHLKKYDMVILGMGTDGHTASLFPQAENLALALSDESPDCVDIDPVTNDMMRVTQSLKRLLKTREVIFHLMGEEKNNILQEVIKDTNKEIYPASHVIHQDATPVEIYYAQLKEDPLKSTSQ